MLAMIVIAMLLLAVYFRKRLIFMISGTPLTISTIDRQRIYRLIACLVPRKDDVSIGRSTGLRFIASRPAFPGSYDPVACIGQQLAAYSCEDSPGIGSVYICMIIRSPHRIPFDPFTGTDILRESTKIPHFEQGRFDS